jgi:hypothetical protein
MYEAHSVCRRGIPVVLAATFAVPWREIGDFGVAAATAHQVCLLHYSGTAAHRVAAIARRTATAKFLSAAVDSVLPVAV